MFYEKFLKLCAEANKTPSSVAGDLGLSRSAVSNWKARGSCPTAVTAQKIADYFGVPVDDLLSGETDEKTKKAAPTDGDGTLTESQQELFALVQRMSDDEITLFLDIARRVTGQKPSTTEQV